MNERIQPMYSRPTAPSIADKWRAAIERHLADPVEGVALRLEETDPELPQLDIDAIQCALDAESDFHGALEECDIRSELRGALLAWHAAKLQIEETMSDPNSQEREDLYSLQNALLSELSADARELLVESRNVVVGSVAFEAIESEAGDGELVVRVDSWQVLAL